MKTYYKILKLASEVVKPETENAPVNYFLFFGPPFRSKAVAKSWLKENSASGAEYTISRFYTLSLPDGLQLKKKKNRK